jgi:glycosyltransferase involved in cell wall biosynthesis
MIVFVHLLNDASGSPRVLKSVISSLRNSEENLLLYIGSDGSGFLTECGIEVRKYWYKRSRLKLITLVNYLGSQIHLFLRLLKSNEIERDAIIYINTVLPFGAALYGWITGRRVIFHLHETSISPRLLKRFLISIVQLTSKLNIYVSDAHRSMLPIRGVPSCRIYNCLDSFILGAAATTSYDPRRNGTFTILLIASLRDYKGIPEYLELARCMETATDTRFELLVNDEQQDVNRYFRGISVPANLTVTPRVSDPTPFYKRASLLLNLSRMDMWVETFGLTILEAMSFGVPVIAPPVGGPAEIVRNGIEGYLVDSRKNDELMQRVNALRHSPELCILMSSAALERVKNFTPDSFISAIRETINQMDCA